MPNLNTCFNCGGFTVTCECVQCIHCGDRLFSTDICTQCRRCLNGCCNCVSCITYGCNVRSSTTRHLCTGCLNCSEHCTCYKCSTCSIQVPPTQRNRENLNRVWCHNCNKCNAHCTCYHCGYLSMNDSGLNVRCTVSGPRSAVCTTCNNCPTHCNCTVCSICEIRVFHVHDSCGLCSRCCSCNARGVSFRNGKFGFHNSSFGNGEFKRNRLRRHIAVETEVDAYKDTISSSAVNRSINKWRDAVVRDGSIGDYGFEITTNPTNGDKFLDHIKELTEGLQAIKATCSEKCGLHVHVNVKGDVILDKEGKPVLDEEGKFTFDKRTAYSQYDLRRLTLIYAKVEAAMFALCEPRRLTSRYSTICGKYWTNINQDFRKFRKDLLSKMYFDGNSAIHGTKESVTNYFGGYPELGRSLDDKKRHKYETVRYKALNIHSYFMRGTIEFRHHEGTIDYNEITNWALICGYIVEAASKLSDAEVAALPADSCEALLTLLPSKLQTYCKAKWEIYNTVGWERYRMIMHDNFSNLGTNFILSS